MAGEDRTESPTPKRLREARKRGQLPMSREVGSALGILALFGVFASMGGYLVQGYGDLLRNGIKISSSHPAGAEGIFAIIWQLGMQAAPLLLIPAAIVGVAGIAAGLLQSRFNFATEALKPDFKKINPLQGLKRIFGYRGLFEVFKELIKVVIIGGTAWVVLWPQKDQLAALTGIPVSEILIKIGSLSLRLGFAVAIAYLAIAVVDYLFQRYSTNKELKMTKEEVRQEAKQTDMSPEMKRAIKQRQMEAARQRMMAQVPEADVVITNPTHYAVALAYQPGEPAPRVIASGVDLIAFEIRSRAEKSGVQVVENPPLARSLYAMARPGDWIPAELYVAVAEVLAYVYRRRQQPVEERA